ncbi:ABC transporter permease [Pseudonocardia bannensis]|uniref:ABC transporter permease n=1 Tax=Pseudonocardia bannensis TaxID=630973 RepID=A0A848DGC8_9PSEU|nr:ABC transporter permease [Pseudonocardia bannensis]NMH91581.1 ABC transporter permease [Pseudonocardia bannensis]
MTTLPPPTGGSPADTAEVAAAARPTTQAPHGGRRSAGPGQLSDIWRRYRRNRLALLGLGIVGLLVFLAIFEPFITPFSPFEQNLLNTTAPPSARHWFGTDVLGRDMFSAIIYGAKLAVIVGLATVAMSLLIGVVFGAIAGFRGGAVDSVIMRTTDVFLAFPLLVGAILVVRTFGAGVTPVIIALALFGWTTSARLMRGQTLALRESEYVEAARSIGATDRRIISRHILPNAIAPVLVYAFTNIGVVVVAMASLSFLGIGVPADIPEWGRLISQSAPFFQVPGKSHLWAFPALAICVTTLGFAFVADGLRDALDPKLRGRG